MPNYLVTNAELTAIANAIRAKANQDTITATNAIYLVDGDDLTSLASAIRTQGNTEASLAFPQGFISAINNLPSMTMPSQLTFPSGFISAIESAVSGPRVTVNIYYMSNDECEDVFGNNVSDAWESDYNSTVSSFYNDAITEGGTISTYTRTFIATNSTDEFDLSSLLSDLDNDLQENNEYHQSEADNLASGNGSYSFNWTNATLSVSNIYNDVTIEVLIFPGAIHSVTVNMYYIPSTEIDSIYSDTLDNVYDNYNGDYCNDADGVSGFIDVAENDGATISSHSETFTIYGSSGTIDLSDLIAEFDEDLADAGDTIYDYYYSSYHGHYSPSGTDISVSQLNGNIEIDILIDGRPEEAEVLVNVTMLYVPSVQAMNNNGEFDSNLEQDVFGTFNSWYSAFRNPSTSAPTASTILITEFSRRYSDVPIMPFEFDAVEIPLEDFETSIRSVIDIFLYGHGIRENYNVIPDSLLFHIEGQAGSGEIDSGNAIITIDGDPADYIIQSLRTNSSSSIAIEDLTEESRTINLEILLLDDYQLNMLQ